MTDNPRIGKDVIESLTLGMYEDCRFIYREYIQNSADQVDKAVAEGLINAGEDEIHITINPKERCIVIEDNATGISSDKVIPILRNIAHSTKKRGEDKGFRGIGRLGGLGYCSKLIFETTFAGEEVKSIMTWDADLLKQIINDRDNSEEAVDVLARVTDTIHKKEAADKHYFKVILENVTSDELLNVERVKLDKVYTNEKLLPVITALGCGVGDEIDLEKLRYGKVIVMADADVDGSHIRTLLLTFFFRFMRPLIEEGHIYLAQPPLFKLSRGRKIRYAYSDTQRDEMIAELGADGGKVDIQRYKGLGEMDAEQLWETTMDPEHRTMVQVTMEDAERADEIFTILMGDKVAPRREFIEQNAKFVSNLDI